MGKETRKVLRNEKFRTAMDAKGKEVSGAEELGRKAKYGCEVDDDSREDGGG